VNGWDFSRNIYQIFFEQTAQLPHGVLKQEQLQLYIFLELHKESGERWVLAH